MLIENKYLKLLFTLLIVLILIFILLPIITIIIMSFNASRSLSFPLQDFTLDWYFNYFESKTWLTATVYSLQIGFLTACSTTVLGIMAAYALVRGKFRGKDISYILLVTPLVVPPMVLAIALYFFFVNLQMIGSVFPIVIGHTIITFPIVLVTVSSSLQGINPNLEKASMSLGASRFKTFYKIVLPLILPGVISGALFSFLLSFDELLIPMFLGGVQISTLPTQIWGSLTYSVDPTVSAVSSLIIFTIIILLLTIQYFTRKKEDEYEAK
ncbi:ABC transporter permease [Virgibacillus kimchii]